MRASGSLATFVSRMILPAESTKHTLLASKEKQFQHNSPWLFLA
jgi:hypothetical protein